MHVARATIFWASLALAARPAAEALASETAATPPAQILPSETAAAPPAQILPSETAAALAVIALAAANTEANAAALVKRLRERFERDTTFDAKPFEAAAVAHCRGDFVCMATVVRGSSRREASDAGPRLLLVLSLLPGGDARTTIATAALIDLAAETSSAEAEILAQSGPDDVRADRTEGYADQLVDRKLYPALDRASLLDRPATIVLSDALPGLTIVLDGRKLGVTRLEPTHLVRVAPGSHELTLESSEGPVFSAPIEAAGGASLSIDASLTTRRPPSAIPAVAVWSGAALLAGGGAMMLAGLLNASSAEQSALCVDLPGGAGCGVRFETLGGGDTGVLAAPLGYSLAIAGGSWLASGLAIEDGPALWLALAGGAAAGALAYGLSAALNSPPK